MAFESTTPRFQDGPLLELERGVTIIPLHLTSVFHQADSFASTAANSTCDAAEQDRQSSSSKANSMETLTAKITGLDAISRIQAYIKDLETRNDELSKTSRQRINELVLQSLMKSKALEESTTRMANIEKSVCVLVEQKRELTADKDSLTEANSRLEHSLAELRTELRASEDIICNARLEKEALDNTLQGEKEKWSIHAEQLRETNLNLGVEIRNLLEEKKIWRLQKEELRESSRAVSLERDDLKCRLQQEDEKWRGLSDRLRFTAAKEQRAREHEHQLLESKVEAQRRQLAAANSDQDATSQRNHALNLEIEACRRESSRLKEESANSQISSNEAIQELEAENKNLATKLYEQETAQREQISRSRQLEQRKQELEDEFEAESERKQLEIDNLRSHVQEMQGSATKLAKARRADRAARRCVMLYTQLLLDAERNEELAYIVANVLDLSLSSVSAATVREDALTSRLETANFNVTKKENALKQISQQHADAKNGLSVVNEKLIASKAETRRLRTVYDQFLSSIARLLQKELKAANDTNENCQIDASSLFDQLVHYQKALKAEHCLWKSKCATLEQERDDAVQQGREARSKNQISRSGAERVLGTVSTVPLNWFSKQIQGTGVTIRIGGCILSNQPETSTVKTNQPTTMAYVEKTYGPIMTEHIKNVYRYIEDPLFEIAVDGRTLPRLVLPDTCPPQAYASYYQSETALECQQNKGANEFGDVILPVPPVIRLPQRPPGAECCSQQKIERATATESLEIESLSHLETPALSSDERSPPRDAALSMPRSAADGGTGIAFPSKRRHEFEVDPTMPSSKQPRRSLWDRECDRQRGNHDPRADCFRPNYTHRPGR